MLFYSSITPDDRRSNPWFGNAGLVCGGCFVPYEDMHAFRFDDDNCFAAFNECARRHNIHAFSVDFGNAGGAERGDGDAGFCRSVPVLRS
jgi:hypothetical protein